MLTDRQQEILHLIVRLYGEFEEPIGSKTLLQQSVLNVSSATVRNDMLALERQGYLQKAHSSSGRIPSFDGYRHYVNRLIHRRSQLLEAEDEATFQELFKDRYYDPLRQAQLASDILVSATGHTVVVWQHQQSSHCVKEFRLIHLTNYSVIGVLLTDQDAVESQLFELNIGIERDTLRKVAELINEEIQGLSLEDAYQRMKVMIPLLLQRSISYQLDFSSLFEKMVHHLNGHDYFVSGKNNLFDMISTQLDSTQYKKIFNFVDGSPEMLRLLGNRTEGLEVLFGVDVSPNGLANVNMITGTYCVDNRKIVIGLIGPSTMRYHRIIGLMDNMIQELSRY